MDRRASRPVVLGPLARLDAGDRLVVGAWLVARIVFGLGFLTARLALDRLAVARPVPFTQGLLAWDGAAYVDIAELGYGASEGTLVRFFPLLPLVADLVGVVGIPASWTLVFLANATTLAAGLLVRRVLHDTHGDAVGILSGVLVVAGPTSFATTLAYTEGPFLLLTLAVWWFVDRDRPAAVAVVGVLAGLCRPVGILLAVPIGIEAWRDRRNRSLARWLVPTAAPAVGFGAYLWWSRRATGDWLAPFDEQTGLRGDASNPFRVLVDHVGDLFGDDALGDALHLPTVVLLVVLAGVAVRNLPAGWGAFAVVNVAVFLTAPNLNSIERYGFATAPLVVAGAIVFHRIFRRPDLSLAAAAASSQTVAVLLTVLLYLGAYVP